jgi:hypothetical protein
MIKVIKLVSGDDIISEVDVQENFILLKKPQKFIMTPEGVATMPLMPFSNDDEYKISMNHVLFISEADDDLKNGYNSQFGTGIVIAKNNMLITE